MNWTKPSPPIEGKCFYDHVECDTPLGVFRIEWKEWKRNDSFSVHALDTGTYVGEGCSLDQAKDLAADYLMSKANQIYDFLGEKVSPYPKQK